MGKKGETVRTEAEVEVALRQNRGAVAIAAERLGIGRSALYERIQGSDHLQRVKREIDEAVLDAAEFGMSELVDKLDGPMIRFALQTKGRNRGYVTRNETVDIQVIEAFIVSLGDDPAAFRRVLAARGIDPERAVDAGSSPARQIPESRQR